MPPQLRSCHSHIELGKSTGLKTGHYKEREVEAFLAGEEDAGAEGEEHDGEAGGDAKVGSEGRSSRKEEERFLTSADPIV